MKILIVMILFLSIGCAGNPVPEEAVKACLENGGTPIYTSGCDTRFTCAERKP